MARYNLRYAAKIVREIKESHPDDYVKLVDRTGLGPGEAEAWDRAAEAMYIPYSEGLGIHPQDSCSSSARCGIWPTRPPSSVRSCCTSTRW